MPVHLAKDTAAALGANTQHSDSRSLFLSRYADPEANDKKDATPRRDWFNALIRRKAQVLERQPWLPATTSVLYARLQSRLMVGMANGVMENASLALDRYGLPVIPGSAVKGCARRMALQSLHDWVASGPARPAAEDIGAPCCAGFGTPAEMLASIALTFGWVEQDWEIDREGCSRSDFAWACGHAFAMIWKDASEALAAHFGAPVQPQYDAAPWRSLPNFAGAVAFLSASPNRDPGLVLDVVTPHHSGYYASEDPNADAPDTEDPVPVFFPTVQPQDSDDHFTFPLLPLQHCTGTSLSHARLWLARGLEAFGIGAKTNVGYGWFDASEQFNQRINAAVRRKKLVAQLRRDYLGFEDWQSERKDDAILSLADRQDDCRAWAEVSPDTFNPIRVYAEIQGIQLL